DGVGGDRVRQRADAVDLELDRLAGLDPAVELQATAAGHRPGRDDVAGHQLLALGGVGEHLADVVLRAGGAAFAPQLAVDAHAAGRLLPVGQRVGGDGVAADRVGEGL